MGRALALAAALCLILGLAGCAQAEPETPENGAEPVFYDTGAAALASGDYEAAVASFAQAIEADDNRAAAYLGRADSYLALSRSDPGEPSAELRGLALRDYEIALELDPGLGEHVCRVYEDLSDQALAAGETGQALGYLKTAERAASGQTAERIREQARQMTDGILAGSIWYMDAPDSRYYEFYGDGTGRVVDAVAMEQTGGLTYENEGFVLHVTAGGETAAWTYEPDRESYYAPAGPGQEDGPGLRLEKTSPGRMYRQWQRAVLEEEAALRIGREENEDQTAGYAALYEREYALLEELAAAQAETWTEEDAAVLAAEAEARTALEADSAPAREAFDRVKTTVNGLLGRLPEAESGEPVTLDELFPLEEEPLLDYLRQVTGWVLKGRSLTVRGGAEALTGWETLADVDHYFQDGRLYLRVSGYGLRQASGGAEEQLVMDQQGRFSFATPLTAADTGALTEEGLLSRLQDGSWIGLWNVEAGSGAFFLELELAGDMTCSDRGGYYPGELTGRQSGEYALEGNELTLTLSAEGYTPGTYRYRVVPMGESLYMTLLTDGIVYGQTAGSTYVFCGGDFAADVRLRLG